MKRIEVNLYKGQKPAWFDKIDLSKPINPEYLRAFGKVKEDMKNPLVEGVLKQLEESKNRFLLKFQRKFVRVVGIQAVKPQSNRWGTTVVGKVALLIPEGLLQIKVWKPGKNGEKGCFVWKDFAHFNLDATRKRDPFTPPVKGQGLLILAIKRNKEGQLYVTLPKDKGQNDTWYDVFRTKDLRFGKFNSKNNVNLEAAVTAFLRVYAGEHKVANPKNRVGYNQSCLNCRHLVQFPAEYRPELDTVESGQFGNHLPSLICSVTKTFVDMEVIIEANKAQAEEYDPAQYDGASPRASREQVVVEGKPMTLYQLKQKRLHVKCMECPFYHARNQNDFDHTARVERQVVESLVGNAWKVGFPGEFQGAQAFRVVGLGGLVVMPTLEVTKAANLSFVPEEEEITRETRILKTILSIRNAAFSWEQLSDSQRQLVFKLLKGKPVNMPAYLEKQWDAAVSHLKMKLEWIQNPKEELPEFETHFFTGQVEGAKEVYVEEVMGELLRRAQEASILEDFFVSSGKEVEEARRVALDPLAMSVDAIARHHLDDLADELVLEVIQDGTKFTLVGEHADLAARALQFKLQDMIKSLVWGVRKMENPTKALDNLRVTTEVKGYISKALS